MWDFEHPPFNAELAQRYQIDRMSPSQCADRLATGQADIGLVPIASLAANQSKEMRADIDPSVKAASIPDWQSLRTDVLITR